MSKRNQKGAEVQENEEELQEVQPAQPKRRRKQPQNEDEGNDEGAKAGVGAAVANMVANTVTGDGPKRRKGAPITDEGGAEGDDLEEGGQHKVLPMRRKSHIKGNQDLWLLYMLFKAAAYLSYFLLPVVFAKALSYIVVLMMSAIDFWIVKNIVGRKLVKMRWWYIIDNEGNERWHFESRDEAILFQDKLVFWGGLIIHPVLWALFCVMNAITLAVFETSITLVCGLIAAVQFYGFKQCSNAHNRKMKILSRREFTAMRGGRGGRGRGGRGRGRGGRGRGGLAEPLMQNDRYQN